MAAAPALIALVATASNEPMLLTLTTGASETVGPTRLLQSSLAFLLSSLELHKLGQRQTRLELDPIHGHGDHA